VEGERGFISGSQITNVDSENKGLRKYNLL
jgi:hypothetical protein